VQTPSSTGRCSQSSTSCSDAQKSLRQAVWSARVPLKLAIRLTYELGEQLAQRNGQNSTQGQAEVAARVVQVSLEELQRGILEGLLKSSFAGLTDFLERIRQQAANQWAACRNERYALASLLDGAPAEPLSEDAIPYWLSVIDQGVALAAKLSGSQQSGTVKLCSVLWSTVQLVRALTTRIVRAQGHVSLIGLPPQSAALAFSGPLLHPAPGPIDAEIRAELTRIGSPASGPLKYEHLVVYLTEQAAVTGLQQFDAPLAHFLEHLVGSVGLDFPSLVRLVLQNGGAFAPVGSTTVDASAAVTALSNGLSNYASQNLTDALRAQLSSVLVDQPDVQTAFDEVLIPTARFAINKVFGLVATWAKANVSPTQLTEALSAILLRLIGRSLVVSGDVMLAAAQSELASLMTTAAAKAGDAQGLVDRLMQDFSIALPVDEVLELVQDALEVGADTFGPMPDDKRRTVRNLLYRAIDPMVDTTPEQLVVDLGNTSLIPNVDTLDALARELGGYATERFVYFAQALFQRIVDRQVDEWRQALDRLAQQIDAWIDTLTGAVREIEARLGELARNIAAAIHEAEQRLADVTSAINGMLEAFGSAAGRDRFLTQAARDASGIALGVLEDNWIYQNVVPGSIKAEIRDTVRGTVRAAINNDVTDEVLAIIGLATGEIDDLVDDLRALPHDQPIKPQIREIFLGRLKALIDDHMQAQSIRIRVAVAWDLFGHHSETIDLGRIGLPVELIMQAVQKMTDGLAAFEGALDQLAAALKALFDAEDAVERARIEQQNLTSQRDRAHKALDTMGPAQRQIRILRPLPAQTISASATVQIEFAGFDSGILDHDSTTPGRVHAILNGSPLDVSAFKVRAYADAAERVPTTARGADLVVATRQGPIGARRPLPKAAIGPSARSSSRFGSSAAASRPSVRLPTAATAPGFILSGEIPEALLRAGINVLLVEAFVAKGQRIHTAAAFFYAAAPRDVVPVPIMVPGKLPAASPPRPAGLLALSRADRKAIAASLATKVDQSNLKPLAPLAGASPVVATRLGLSSVGKPLQVLPTLSKKR
jgi:hypothetical protein